VALEQTKQILDLREHGRAPCGKVAELGDKHLQEIDSRLAQLRKYHRLLDQALNDWRKENVTARQCAGEFCDLIERLA
jgi:DNA-binding transcriptional MerR regulator